MRYWNDNRKSCEHVEPREDWKESIEKWIDWMDAIGRTNDTLRTRWYQIVRFSKAVDKSITDVTEDDLIFYLAGMGTEGRRGVRSCVKVFYQWSMKRGLARRNPADEVPTVPMTLPSGCICPEENIEQGLASPDENARLAVMLGAFCGLRRIEMTRINLKTDLEENAEGSGAPRPRQGQQGADASRAGKARFGSCGNAPAYGCSPETCRDTAASITWRRGSRR